MKNYDYQIDRLKELLRLKEMQVSNNDDELMRINELKKFFRNDRCFFTIQIESAISILQYLGIPKHELVDTYIKLTDPKLLSSDVNFEIIK